MTRLGLGRAVVCIAVMVIATASGFPSHAADKAGSEKAREHFKSGEAFFKLEKFKDALEEYELGYMARSDASFLYNIAQCHRLMGNKTAALRFYRRFLDEATRVPNRPMVEQHIRDLENALAAAPADPAPPAPAPAASTPALDLSAPAPSPSETTLVASPTTVSTTSSSTATASDDEPLTKRWWFWPAVGVVAVGAGVGTYLVLRGGSDCPAGRVCM